MSNLVLELRQGEVMIVNGAPIRFRTKSRIELTAHARFLFGKQIMPPDQADSPARRIYFALQSAYIGSDDERRQGLASARDLVASFKAATTSGLACEILDRALAAAEADDCYQALKLIRRVIRHEDVVLGRATTSATPPTNPALAPSLASSQGPSLASVPIGALSGGTASGDNAAGPSGQTVAERPLTRRPGSQTLVLPPRNNATPNVTEAPSVKHTG
jgi:flagellar protein FlbT